MHRPVEILLVEDNPADAELARRALLEGRVEKRITIVKDGAVAIDYVRRRGTFAQALRPDIVLLDLNLPKEDGIAVLRAIKEDATLRSITVIVLTTSGAQRDVNAAYDFSANCYVVKPMSIEGLFAVMRGIEEFWMTAASLPTFDSDPRPSRATDPGGTGKGTADAKKGSATSSRATHRQRTRSAIRVSWVRHRSAAR